MPNTTLHNLDDELASPHPVVRDERALAGLTEIVADDRLNADDQSRLSGAMIERLSHERAEARSFAPPRARHSGLGRSLRPRVDRADDALVRQ